MKNRVVSGFILVCLVLTMAGCDSSTPAVDTSTPAVEDNSSFHLLGESYRNPVPVGVTLETTVEMGDVYSLADLYDVKITLEEVVRGEEAWERIRAQSAANEPPKPGYEYVLALIRFEYYPRGLPGDEPYKLKAGTFNAVGPDLKEYEIPMASPPRPGLSTTLDPGEYHEGWVVLQVPENVEKPFMTFLHTPLEGVYRVWNAMWFQLYY